MTMFTRFERAVEVVATAYEDHPFLGNLCVMILVLAGIVAAA